MTADTEIRDLVLERRHALGQPLERFRRMVEIRAVEDRILGLFHEGHVDGTTHTCQGQEAAAVGVAAATRPSDTVVCTYRGHGHALALGLDPESVMAEILGRTRGCTGGLGGSMHLCNRAIGLFPTTAIVGAGIPIAAGIGLAAQVRGTDDIGVAVFGDGTTNIGAFHEGLNLAAVWSLPVVFVIENNLYGEYSRIDRTTAVENLSARAVSYDIPGVVADGQDVDAVETQMRKLAERARAGEGPALLEIRTYRYAGHSRSDKGLYRPPGELEAWKARDPLVILSDKLIQAGLATEAELGAMSAEIAAGMEALGERVIALPRPDRAAMFANILRSDR